MQHFTVTTEGHNRLVLCELCEAYCNDQYLAAHVTPEQAAESVLEQFKRAFTSELELLSVECHEES